MADVTINGKEYPIPEMDFDTVCQLEENGISLLGMDERNPKIATMLRAFVAWIMGVDTRRASIEINEHLKNGGNLLELMTVITDALEDSGFSKGNRQIASPVKEFPDHRKKNRNRNRNRKSNTGQLQKS